jgi:hypothetical protein
MNDLNNRLEETNVVTEDMKLPAGSAVLQAVIVKDKHGDGGFLDIRAIAVGCNSLDMRNPAHRFLQAVSNRMDEIMAEVSGGLPYEEVDPSVIEEHILAANEQIIDAPQPGETLYLSNGQTVVVQDEDQGGYDCPVCGKDEPHQHSLFEQKSA